MRWQETFRRRKSCEAMETEQLLVIRALEENKRCVRQCYRWTLHNAEFDTWILHWVQRKVPEILSAWKGHILVYQMTRFFLLLCGVWTWLNLGRSKNKSYATKTVPMRGEGIFCQCCGNKRHVCGMHRGRKDAGTCIQHHHLLGVTSVQETLRDVLGGSHQTSLWFQIIWV